MTGLPTLEVTLDDGTGAFATDITDRVSLAAGWGFNSGRTDEFSQAQSGQLQVVLDNADGLVTDGTVGVEPFSSLCRVRETFPAPEQLNLVAAASADLEGGTVASWTAGGTVPPTLSNSTAHAYSGTHALLITWGTGGTLPLASLAVSGLTIGQTYTWSAYVYVPAGNPNVSIAVGGGIGFGSNTGGITDHWLRLTKTAVATSTSHAIQLIGSSPTSGQIAYVDAAMANVGSQAGTFNTYTQTTTTRCTARVSALGLGWPGGGQEFATVGVTAVDKLSDMARRPLRSMLEEHLLLRDDIVVLYPLAEEQGVAAAGDVTLNGNPTLTSGGSGADAAFGGSTSSIDGQSGVTFAGGKYLVPNTTTLGADGITPSIAGPFNTIGCVFTTDAVTAQTLIELEVASLVLTSAGLPRMTSGAGDITGAVAVNDGLEHQIVATFGSLGENPILYVDGVQVATTVSFTEAPIELHAVGGAHSGSFGTFNGVISMVFGTSVIMTGTEVAELYSLRVGGTESTADRLDRICSWVGETPTFVDGSAQVMPLQATNGQSLFDALQDVATAEGGFVYVDPSSTIVLQGRYYRTLKTTAVATLGEQEAAPDTAVTWDTQQKINQVSVTRNGGPAQLVSAAELAADRNTPVYPTSMALLVMTDAEAIAAAQWTLSKHTATGPRLGSVTIDLLSSKHVPELLSAGVGDRLSLPNLPSQLWATAGDYTIEGIAEAQSTSAWTLTFTLLPFALSSGFVLNDPLQGQLNVNSLGY